MSTHSWASMFSLLLIVFMSYYQLVVAPNPEQVRVGRWTGYVGHARARNPGDSMTASFCYCALPENQRTHDQSIDTLAHVYIVEYYNVHRDITFFLSHTCRAHHLDYRSQRNCFMEYDEFGNIDTHEEDWKPEDHLVRTWQINEMVEDYVEYIPNSKSKKSGSIPRLTNWLGYNGQLRDVGLLDDPGDPSYWVVDQWGWSRRNASDIQEACQPMCKEFQGMDVMSNPTKARGDPSHQTLVWAIEDMCAGCH